MARPAADEAAFDFVIVGAGSAGCVLANRLSADPATRVCLIEAGPRDRHPLIHVPLGVMRLLAHPRLNWRYATVPQPELADRCIPVPRGRVLGGSSAINGMVYHRGHPADYDGWAALGNDGWSWREVLPYFRRSENNETWGESAYHGRGGPLNVTDLDTTNPLVEVFLDAAASLQFPRTADFTGAQPEGFGTRQVTMRGGRRHSAATAFLDPARRRANLAIITGAAASRVRLQGRRAVGVEIEQDGETRCIAARREVLLCAGTVASPLLLMRSGIGDPALLAQHGIAVAQASPEVGCNYQDHIGTAVQFASSSTLTYGVSPRTLPFLGWSVLQYALFRRGLLASNILHAAGFLRSEPGLDRPDLQLIFVPARRDPDGRVGRGHGFAVMAVLLHPESRGTVRISGPAWQAPPLIDPRFLSAPRDLDVLLRGVRLARRILLTPGFAPYRGVEEHPGDGVQSEPALRDFIRATASTTFHPVGTCRMGGVVDPQLRVHGVAGLRVVDASVFPTQIGGNTNAPVIMVAERAGDFIRKQALLF
jgi:choline dehydrogenase-like flavoprotein